MRPLITLLFVVLALISAGAVQAQEKEEPGITIYADGFPTVVCNDAKDVYTVLTLREHGASYQEAVTQTNMAGGWPTCKIRMVSYTEPKVVGLAVLQGRVVPVRQIEVIGMFSPRGGWFMLLFPYYMYQPLVRIPPPEPAAPTVKL